MSKFEIYKGKSDWRWRLIADNYKIVAQGQGYASKRNAENATLAVAECANWADTVIL